MTLYTLRRLDAEEIRRVTPLFLGWDDTLIISALDGDMGTVWALDGGDSRSALVENGDFMFIAGEPSAEFLRAYHSTFGDTFAILNIKDEGWIELIGREYGERTRRVTRYAIAKEGDVFDRERLLSYIDALPDGITLARIDDTLYKWCADYDWACDFCSRFESAEDYARRGLGVMALKDGEPVGGASSYICYRGGIELEVDTRRDMRRMGIAAACCARLILDCLERGLYPSWDAANRASVALAQKLGYHEKGEYTVWYVNE